MNDETIVAVYDTPAHAELAAADLKAAGIPDSAITVHAGTGSLPTTGSMSSGSMSSGSMSSGSMSSGSTREPGFWASLFGGEPDHDTAVYDRSMADGATVVTVRAPEAHLTAVMDIMQSHHPIDIDERAASYGLTQQTGSYGQAAATPATGLPPGPAIPATVAATGTVDGRDTLSLSEESLSVGKRLVNRGTTRIRRFVVETPVEQSITLHDEKVVLDRHPVAGGRPVADADFSDKTIEMTETVEQAVVSKTARVVEEVALRKEATERVETVRDTVRKEDVEVVQVPGTLTGAELHAPKI